MKTIEVQLSEALERIKQQDSEIVSLKQEIHKRQIAIAAVERAAKLKECLLPLSSIDRLNEAFKNSTDNAGLKQAINAERRNARCMNKQDLRVEKILGGE